ncbi:MAG: peptidase S8 [Candidatus Eremiobacteraeota bacterium]|nr:peptidase S8 [Candidatus Eremiobacteraeota bacterium]MCW5868552.1 peptidase S8 [Candidatus Eremiobacteraeota bacterium]
MKKLLCAALVGASLTGARAQTVAESTWGPVIDGRLQGMLVLDMEDDADPAALARDHGVRLEFVSAHSRRDKLMIARVEESQLLDTLAALNKDDRVTAVSPNYVYEAASEPGPTTTLNNTQKFPDDPLYKIQWNLQMVNVEGGWKHNAGQNVRVAMVDTGLAYWNAEGHHRLEDLENLKVLEGYDFVREHAEARDEQGQGTHMAGTIAQSTNNGKGAAGIAYEAQIMPFKVLDRQGRGSMADVAAAIRLAGDRKAQVLVLGLGGPKSSEVLHEAVKHARSQGAVIIAATGVKGNEEIPYPAAYPEVLAVSAVDYKGKLTDYSSRGPKIDLAAPGGKNRQTDYSGIVQNTIRQGDARHSGYYQWSGTSMAAAHVAGVASLVVSTGVQGPEAVEKILKETARSKGAKGKKQGYGAGIVDAGRAVAKAQEVAAYQQLRRHLPVGLFLALLAGLSLRRRNACS